MKDLFKDYLFQHHILVSEEEPMDQKVAFNTVIALANIYAIRINEGAYLANETMLKDAARNLGDRVPAPFYRKFPDSVRAMTPDQLLFDQLYHYTQTYGMGWFDEVGHSVLENDIMEENDDSVRNKFLDGMFTEKSEVKNFVILSGLKAYEELYKLFCDLLKSPRPLNRFHMDILYEAVIEYGIQVFTNVKDIPCKQIAVELLYRTKDMFFAKSLKLADTIKLLEFIQFNEYHSKNLSKLNLKNKDRRLITSFINEKFNPETITGMDIRRCFEKRKIWCGLLHHLHYKPTTLISQHFVDEIRSGLNRSVSSDFEWLMRQMPAPRAAKYLAETNGQSALIRNLNYILSRCKNEDEIKEVISCLE